MAAEPPPGLRACNSAAVGFADFCATWPEQSQADMVGPSAAASIEAAVDEQLSLSLIHI